MRPSAMSFVRAMPGDLAATGSKPLSTTVSGVSSMIRSTPVACSRARMLRPLATDDPALHLVARQVDDAHRVLRRVVGGHPLHRGDDDVAGLLVGLVAGLALDRAAELHRVVFGLFAHGLEQEPLGIVRGQARRRARGRRPAPGGPGRAPRGAIGLALAFEQLAGTLLEHVGALVELFVTLEQPPFERGKLAASCSCLFLGLALEAQLLVLGLEDQFLLARTCLGLDAAAFGRCGLHRLGCPDAAQENAEYGSAGGGQEGHHHDELDFHLTPPIRPRLWRPDAGIRL
jgi:hypothetical protein